MVEQEEVAEPPIRPRQDGCDPTGSWYRGRLAPSPTGLLHLGHARTFWVAAQRAAAAALADPTVQSNLVMRVEDLDGDRSKAEFVDAGYEDLSWLGITWTEGPDVGGPHGPYIQSQRMEQYRQALAVLQARGYVYPCYCSRKDIAAALSAPHEGDEEPVYPGMCRPKQAAPIPDQEGTPLATMLGQAEHVAITSGLAQHAAPLPGQGVAPLVIAPQPVATGPGQPQPVTADPSQLQPANISSSETQHVAPVSDQGGQPGNTLQGLGQAVTTQPSLAQHVTTTPGQAQPMADTPGLQHHVTITTSGHHVSVTDTDDQIHHGNGLNSGGHDQPVNADSNSSAPACAPCVCAPQPPHASAQHTSGPTQLAHLDGVPPSRGQQATPALPVALKGAPLEGVHAAHAATAVAAQTMLLGQTSVAGPQPCGPPAVTSQPCGPRGARSQPCGPPAVMPQPRDPHAVTPQPPHAVMQQPCDPRAVVSQPCDTPAVTSQPCDPRAAAAMKGAAPFSVAARHALKAERREAREAGQGQAKAQRQARRRGGVAAEGGGAEAGPRPGSTARGNQAHKCSWRFRVPDGLAVTFIDNCLGTQSFIAGKDFGDFVVWRGDDLPSYQLACTVDDAAMEITEVVRGADLLSSTARQLLLARALGLRSPCYFHSPLVLDPATGVRLAKRHDALSLRALRQQGADPVQLLASFDMPRPKPGAASMSHT